MAIEKEGRVYQFCDCERVIAIKPNYEIDFS